MSALFARVCQSAGLPVPEEEFQFASPRKRRFDYAWPEQRVAVEVEGGAWTAGRHTRGSGFVRDMAKYNEAAIRGWKVLRVTPQQLLVEGPELLKKALA